MTQLISYPMKECLSSGSAPAVVATKITSHFQTSFLRTSNNPIYALLSAWNNIHLVKLP